MDKVIYDYYYNFATQLCKKNSNSLFIHKNMEKDLENINTEVSKQFVTLCQKYLLQDNPATLNLNIQDIISSSTELATFCLQANKDDIGTKYLIDQIFKKI